MTGEAPAIFIALEQSGFAAAIRQSIWLYPVANVGHIVSLVCFAGAVTVMDVRLLGGLAATAPARLIGRARGFAIAALVGMLVTGVVLFSAEASHVAMNPVFQIKAALIVAGIAHIAVFQIGAERVGGGPAPRAAPPSPAGDPRGPWLRGLAAG